MYKRQVEESEYYDPDTGEVWASLEDVPDGANWVERPVKYRDVDYTVAVSYTHLDVYKRQHPQR